ncbi:MAG: chromosome segregation protein SMC [bacterium]
MYLKSLSLYGFKTFAKRTVFDFKRGATAVIGPNGSGKSNLIDAIAWAIGEQSVRSLRSRKMEEVVFHGSTAQKPLGYAEVILTFDNEDGFFPLPQSEIAIMRRYYKSGESEFTINRESCRLRDIHNLLLDTGLATTGYSIVNQGDVEYIIDLTPQQRREIFVEAAGIIKYKMEKIKTQQKIAETEQNIARLRDSLMEIESSLDALREQAEKAKRYEDVVEEMEKLKLGVFADDIRRMTERLQQQTGEEDRLTKRRSELKEDAVKLRGNQAQLTAKMETDRRAADLLLQQLAVVGGRVGRAEESVRYLTRSIEEIDRQSADSLREQGSLKTQTDILQKEIVRLGEHAEAKKKRLAEAQAELEKLAAGARDDFKLRESDLTKQRNELLAEMDVIKGKETALLSELTVAGDRLRNLQSQIKERSRDRENLKKQADKLQADLKNGGEKTAAFETAIKAKEEAVESLRKRIEELNARKRESQAVADEITAQINSIKVRVSTLEKIAGITRGSSKKGDGSAGSVSIAETVEIEEGFRLAVQRALDDLLNASPVKLPDIRGILKEAKDRNGIYAVVELLNSVQAPDLEKLAGGKGCLGLLGARVKFKSAVDPSLISLFNRFIIVDGIKTLEAIAPELPAGSGAVTLDGAACFSEGILRTGEALPTADLIAGRVEELKAELKEKESEAAAKTKAAIEPEKELKQASQTFSTEGNALIRLREELNAALSRLQTDEDRVDFFEREMKTMDFALVEWSKAASELEKTASDSQTALDAVRNDKKQLEAKLKERQTELDGITDNYRKKDTARSDLRVEIGEINRDIEGVNDAVRYRGSEIERLKLRGDDISRALGEMKGRRDNAVRELDAATIEMNETRAEQGKAASELEQKKAALGESGAELGEVNKAVEENELESSDLREKILECELKRARTETQLDDTRRQFEEEFPGMTDQEAIEKAGVTETGRKSRYLNLRRELESLLPVNQLAIGEYDEKRNRRDYLLEQISDLEATRTSLVDVMLDYDKRSREQYLDTFTKVRDSFRETFFEMFGGGEAQLTMESGCDPLEAGVDMSIQIPGKRMRGITLLSGGEKALSALVLIFAILKVKPSPFYILDEVDAGLDDTNIVRFREMLKKYSRDSQFIVVTHNKGTLAGVDHFFGITLKEEEGYSKVLSVSID